MGDQIGGYGSMHGSAATNGSASAVVPAHEAVFVPQGGRVLPIEGMCPSDTMIVRGHDHRVFVEPTQTRLWVNQRIGGGQLAMALLALKATEPASAAF